jgi:NTP pyrophosphatase (non-canonical NTP hydrolase)
MRGNRATRLQKHRGAPKGLLLTAEQFNALVPVGSAVRYYPLAGEPQHRDTKTRSEAWELGHGEHEPQPALFRAAGSDGHRRHRLCGVHVKPSDDDFERARRYADARARGVWIGGCDEASERVLLYLLGKARSRFAIGAEHWPGISKLMEEAGEVVQICGKLLGTYGETKHWNCPDLKARLEEELGDLLAAADFVQMKCGLDMTRVDKQRRKKRLLFEKWHAEGDPLPKDGG